MSGAGAEAGGASGRSVTDLLRVLGWSKIIAAEPSSEFPRTAGMIIVMSCLSTRFRRADSCHQSGT